MMWASRRITKPPYTVLLAIVVAGALRIWFAGEHLWIDELHTAWTLSGSWLDVASRATAGNQSPAYFLLTWPISDLAGLNEWSLRAPSILSGLLLVAAASGLTWRWSGSALAAGLVAWLIAIDPWFVFYSTEARPYGLVQLLGVVQAYLFSRCFQPPSRTDSDSKRFSVDWPLVFVSALLFYLHYTAAWLFFVEIAYSAICWRWLKHPTASRLGQSGLVFTALATPGILHMARLFSSGDKWSNMSSIKQLGLDLWPALLGYVAVPAILFAIACLADGNWRKNGWRGYMANLTSTKPGITWLPFVTLWAVIPVLVVVVAAYSGLAPLALYRYAVVGSAAFPMLGGLIVSSINLRAAQWVSALLVVGFAIALNPFASNWRAQGEFASFRNENWLHTVSEINSRTQKSNQPVFLFANIIEDSRANIDLDPRFQDYLRFAVTGIYRLDARQREIIPMPTLAGSRFAEVHRDKIYADNGCWLIVRGHASTLNSIIEELKALLSEHPSEPRIQTLRPRDGLPFLISVDF